MKFTIEYNDLEPILKDLCDISAPKEGELGRALLIGTDEDRVLFSTTGTGIIAYAFIDANIIKDGEIIIEAKLLHTLLKKLTKNQTLTFAVKGGSRTKCLEVTAGDGTYEYDPYKLEFPIPNSKYHWDYSLKAETLTEMLNKAGWLSGVKMEEHQSAEGVLIEFADQKFNIISSDLVKFACVTYDIPEDEKITPISAIAPSVLIKTLMKHIKKSENVTIHISDEHIKFSLDKINYISSLISAEYPDIRGAMDTDEEPVIVLVQRTTFTKTVDRLVQFTDKIRQMLTFELKHRKAIKVASHNISNKRSSNELLPEKWENKCSIYTGINGQKLLEILKKIKADEVRLLFRQGEHSPLEIQEPENNNVYYLLSSLRID
jgi:DNA polymerase-3 subunit beta